MNHRLLILLFIVFSTLSGMSAVSKAGYPDPNDQYVNDYAGILTEDDYDGIRNMFTVLEENTGKQAVVVTIESISNYRTGDRSIESFATNLFNRWGVGNKENNDGLMILVARKDRTCRIELGGGYGMSYNSAMQSVIDKKMLPYFKQDDYSRGIREGALAAVTEVTSKAKWVKHHKWHIGGVIMTSLSLIAIVSCMISGRRGWGWVYYAIIGGFIVSIVSSMVRGGGSSGGFGGGSSFGGGASGRW